MPEPDASLRDRLVAVGVDLVAREGDQALTLREIARRAGVSHGAPRRYFPTHRALLAAVAREGYQHLGQRVVETLSATSAEPEAYQPRARHCGSSARSAPSVLSPPWPG